MPSPLPLLHRRQPRWLLARALAAALLSAAPSLQAQSLLEMVQQASGYDAQWRAALAHKQAAERRSDQARAALLPQVGVGAELARSHTRVQPLGLRHDGTTRTVALQAAQPLYRPADRLTLAQSKLAIEDAAHQLDASAQDLIVRVAQAYFDVLAAQDTLAVVRAQKAAVQEQLAAAQRNFDVGNATITDTREAQARFDLIRAQEIAAENSLQVRRLALDQTVGLHGTRPWPLKLPAHLLAALSPTGNAASHTPDGKASSEAGLEPGAATASDQPDKAMPAAGLQDWVARAEQHQPQIRRAQLALQQARLETDKAKTGHLPTVNLSARLAQVHNPNGTPAAPHPGTRNQQASIGVALNMPLFAGFAVQNRVKETLALQEQARAQLDQAQRQTVQATREAFFGLQSGLSQVQALQAAEASSLSALEANQLGYQVGVRINIDVLNAQSQLYQTRRELAQARYGVLMAQLRLAQASGTLGLDAVRRINALLAPPADVPRADAPAAAPRPAGNARTDASDKTPPAAAPRGAAVAP
ncbi:TolC family protein [Vandammella animalimorsus]|uniref:Channel protein TolC n=1 Tax=Vandammella animalimorsus TaxID=2029117 RepID=A0A2A2AK40_9BURK|nr:TolC family protein [Vandammella animalimorsus]PAT38101.1 channel protein TolC [Vandammella animalimorsus]